MPFGNDRMKARPKLVSQTRIFRQLTFGNVAGTRSKSQWENKAGFRQLNKVIPKENVSSL